MRKIYIVSILIILLFTLIFKVFLVPIITKNNEVKKENTPKNISVAIIPTPTMDLIEECKEYSKPKLPLENTADIQKVIGYKNNKFGLYVYSVNDFIIKASEMVNSNGGEWGYVLIPYNIDEYNEDKWNKVFNTITDHKLIPIVQLWGETKDYNKMKERISKAAVFLNSLNWPIEKRYISVFNEMNDKKFWEAGVDPHGYAEILNYSIDVFKAENRNFFMLNGAFNASATGGLGYMSEDVYLVKMNEKVPGIFNKLDGWASHPYPHVNGYLGTPNDTGRNSIRAYQWELNILEQNFGRKNIPVFITETGWPHAEGKKYNNQYLNDQTAAKYLKQAFEKVWLPDPRVVAVTPFTIKYDPPFDHFSFIKEDGGEYKIYKVLKDMKKEAGIPPLVKKYNPLEEYCKTLNK